ncbi:hypothetical protein CANMA_000495 [Candida margitis]|uniref:uncharacterized protein n=1 Tax=Candida margitis TaxID=1775924 RepID=UPI002226D7C7|nr:uncharacterized protein CANMA_000495 [Candida margitis]KAI5970444.1 hypothetical protein CANMA_000495 [Candida margitis]
MSTQPNTQFASSSTGPKSVIANEEQQQQLQSPTQAQQSLTNTQNHHHHHHHHHHKHPHPHAHHHHHIINNPNHHHHHHHPQHSNHASSQNTLKNNEQQVQFTNDGSGNRPQVTTVQTSLKKRSKPQLNLEPIESIVDEFFPERRFIGTIVYNPTTTWETLQTRTLYGLKPSLISRFDEIRQGYRQQVKLNNLSTRYIPIIPPLPQEYINSIIEIKIPFRYIVEFKQDLNNEIVSRELWGGASGVYTDDSDILQVLLHMGLFDNSIDLSVWNKMWEKEDLLRPMNIFNQSQNRSSKSRKEEEETKGGENEDAASAGEAQQEQQLKMTASQPVANIQSVDKNIFGDLSVQILLLPALPSYHGFYANGINSRSWNLAQSTNTQHSGLSYAVYNVKWEERDCYLQDKNLMRAVEVENEIDYELNHEIMREKGGWNFDYDAYKKIKSYTRR